MRHLFMAFLLGLALGSAGCGDDNKAVPPPKPLAPPPADAEGKGDSGNKKAVGELQQEKP